MRKQFVGVMLAGLAAVFAAPAPALAQAQAQAFTSTTVNLYAGPAGDYPVVAQVPGGISLAVIGCVAGYSWCDVSLPGLRGWVWGGYLTYPWQGARVAVMNYGPAIGLPIVTFSLGAYWGSYYRDRPWYGNQSRWYRHPGPRPVPPPVIRPPVRPPGHGPRPPGGHHGNKPGAGNGNGHRPPNNGARPPDQGGARPPGNSGARPPGQGGGRPPGGGGNNRPPGGGGDGSGGGRGQSGS